MSQKKEKEKKNLKKLEIEIDETINLYERTKQEIGKQRDYLDYFGEHIDKNIWDGNYIKKALSTYGQYPELLEDPLYHEHTEFLLKEVSGIKDFAINIYNRSKNTSFNFAELSGDISQSDMNMSSGVSGIKAYYPNMVANHPSLPIQFYSPEENPYRKIEKLIEKLDSIDKILPERLTEIRKSKSVLTQIKHLKNVGNLIREFMSEFLHLCDPKNQVNNVNWVEKSKNNIPTQASRVKFAIAGNNPKFSSKDQVDKMCGPIATKYRELYTNLNYFAHFRGRYFNPKDAMNLDICYSKMLDYTRIILDLRSLHFND